MKQYIPTDVVKKIIADILIERGNKILDDADRLAEIEINEGGVASEYQGEIETTSAGTYVLADDVLCGQISIQEAIETVLNKYEVKEAKSRCVEWINKQNEFEK